MFAPTKIWRRWHRRPPMNQRRYAVASALAGSAIPALVMARGHRVEKIAEVPLVVDNSAFDNVVKSKDALNLLTALGAADDVLKAKNSRHIRAGHGKNRNRKYVQRRGPLLVYTSADSQKLWKAFRNLPGVELVNVERLNLLTLAPGGHIGRFCIWTKSAFQRLDKIYGTYTKKSATKKGYTLPRPLVTNPDLGRIVNSSEVQSVLRSKVAKKTSVHAHRRNPLSNHRFRLRLNPYATSQRKTATHQSSKKNPKKSLPTERRLPRETLPLSRT